MDKTDYDTLKRYQLAKLLMERDLEIRNLKLRTVEDLVYSMIEDALEAERRKR